MRKVVFNSKLNAADLKDHISVGVMILNNYDQVLILDHVKLNMLTIPVGKGEPGETAFEAICKECWEETGLIINSAIEVLQFDTWQIKNGIKVNEYNHIFICVDYKGKLENKEPQKHRDLFWMDLDEFYDLDTISFMTNTLNDAISKGYIEVHSDKIDVNTGRDRDGSVKYNVIYKEHRA